MVCLRHKLLEVFPFQRFLQSFKISYINVNIYNIATLINPSKLTTL